MADDHIYKKAIERRRTLLLEVEKIDIFLELYRELSGAPASAIFGEVKTAPLQKPDVAFFSEAAPPSGRTDHFVPPALMARYGEAAGDDGAKPGGMSQAEFNEIGRRLLLAHGRPLTSPELLKRFAEIGKPIGGNDELKNIGTKLWRAKDVFFNMRGLGYWILDTPCSAIGYEPAKAPEDTSAATAEDKTLHEINIRRLERAAGLLDE